jgi:two-component system KDP operon response regulator KdpE
VSKEKSTHTILIIEDEPQIRKMLTLVLEDENFKIIECETGKSAVRLGASAKPDLILLDLGLPDMDGRDVITALREWCQAPIIILSGRSSDKDVIELLNHGADDYVIKPFNFEVLRARINASLRKSSIKESGEPELSNGPLRMDLVRHQVFLRDVLIALTPKEYNLLRYFMIHCGKMLSHRDILREVWGTAHSDDTQYLRVFVGQLREKIEQNPALPTIITTELGIGYRMEVIQDSEPHKQGEREIPGDAIC